MAEDTREPWYATAIRGRANPLPPEADRPDGPLRPRPWTEVRPTPLPGETFTDGWGEVITETPDVVRITSETGGQKDKKINQMSTLDPEALLALAAIAGKGAEKYSPHNYLKGYDWSLSFDAMQRHLLAFWAGENLDPESGQPHVGHAAWHALALLGFQLRGIGTDDRPPTIR